MKKLISLRMEVNPFRVIVVLLAIPTVIIGLLFVSGVVVRMLGYDFTPAQKKLRVGMSMENVREILGDPDHIARLDQMEEKEPREDWWYSKDDTMQLTFEAGRLVSNHSKDLFRE